MTKVSDKHLIYHLYTKAYPAKGDPNSLRARMGEVWKAFLDNTLETEPLTLVYNKQFFTVMTTIDTNCIGSLIRVKVTWNFDFSYHPDFLSCTHEFDLVLSTISVKSHADWAKTFGPQDFRAVITEGTILPEKDRQKLQEKRHKLNRARMLNSFRTTEEKSGLGLLGLATFCVLGLGTLLYIGTKKKPAPEKQSRYRPHSGTTPG